MKLVLDTNVIHDDFFVAWTKNNDIGIWPLVGFKTHALIQKWLKWIIKI